MGGIEENFSLGIEFSADAAAAAAAAACCLLLSACYLSLLFMEEMPAHGPQAPEYFEELLNMQQFVGATLCWEANKEDCGGWVDVWRAALHILRSNELMRQSAA